MPSMSKDAVTAAWQAQPVPSYKVSFNSNRDRRPERDTASSGLAFQNIPVALQIPDDDDDTMANMKRAKGDYGVIHQVHQNSNASAASGN